MKPAEFYLLTIGELIAVIRANQRRLESQFDVGIAHAWHVAALGRAKSMPTLRQLLNKNQPKQLTREELDKRREEHEQMIEEMLGA